jgi:hypothetical protein
MCTVEVPFAVTTTIIYLIGGAYIVTLQACVMDYPDLPEILIRLTSTNQVGDKRKKSPTTPFHQMHACTSLYLTNLHSTWSISIPLY